MTDSSQDHYKIAVGLFQVGKFSDAENLLKGIVDEEPNNFGAVFLLGYLALLSNRLEDAQNWLSIALEVNPDDQGSKSLLAEVYYRQDNFPKAAHLYSDLGRTAMAGKLDCFTNIKPYAIEESDLPTKVDFVITDPLPVVQACINGSQPVNLFIDTGAAEVILDSEFAKEIEAKVFGSEVGTFAGGDQADIQHGRIDSLTMNDLVIKNLPVNIMDTRKFSDSIFGGRQIDGIIGTTLFYHFLTTIDYPNEQLILRQKSEAALQKFANELKENTDIFPFWMAGDHILVSWGTLNQSEPMLFFIDTGLVGGGFTCPESTLTQENIELQKDLATEGLGGAGKVVEIPFPIQELTLGRTKENNIRGQFMGDFPLEYAFGFRIGGLISHDFLKPYALTFDFINMQCYLQRPH